MIRTVQIQSEYGSRTFDLFNPEASGFLLYNIEGLGPGDIIVNTADRPYDGNHYISSRKGIRTIALYIKPLWSNGMSIERRRNELYRYFPFKKKITLTITSDTRKAKIDGYVANFDPQIFSAAETFQIEITCPDPYFIKLPTSTADFFSFEATSHFKLITPKIFQFEGNGVDASFAIPNETHVGVAGAYDAYQKIERPSGVSVVKIDNVIIPEEDYRYIPASENLLFLTGAPADGSVIEVTIENPGNTISTRTYTNDRNINYAGEMDTGVLIRIIFFEKYTRSLWVGKRATNEWLNVSLYNKRLHNLLEIVLPQQFPDVTFVPSVDYYIKPEDIVQINTNPGEKGIYLIRNILGKEYYLSLANCVFDSDIRPFKWWTLGPGDNAITIGSTQNDILHYANIAIDYAEKYTGI